MTFKSINLFYFLFALILLPLSPIISIFKWRALVRAQHINVPFKMLAGAFLKGLFLGTVTPGKLGEFWRAKYLTELTPVSGGRAFYTALMDRLAVLVVIIPVALLGVLNLLLFGRIKMEIGWLILVLFLALVSGAIYFLIQRKEAQKVTKVLLGFFLPSSVREKADLFFRDFFKAMKEMNPALFAKVLGWAVAYCLAMASIYYLLAVSLGVKIGFFNLFLIIALSWIVLLLPVTVLGLGTREATYIFFFSIFNIPGSLAVAFSLLILLVGIILSVPGIILILKK